MLLPMHLQASPLLTEDRAQECIDPRLGDKYPATGALKVSPHGFISHLFT
uniref:Uncharacterized protein n=1 Tax=Aegilops tauschii subsp. strangulata TaxID=200361 RepID=A0A453CA75_AEGTS